MRVTTLALAVFCCCAPAAYAAAPAPVPATAAPELELLNAYDAFGGSAVKGLKQDYGFSMVVRYRGHTILFDAGNDASILEKNLFLLRVNPKKIDIAIASHGHVDHISGFDYLLKMNPGVKLFFPHDVAMGAPFQIPLVGPEPDAGAALPPEQKYFDGKQDKLTVRSSGRFWRAKVEYVGSNKEIAPGITLIVTPSPLTGYFNKYPPYDKEPFFIPMPELSASFETANGDVLLVGCAHSTLDTIIKEAKAQLKRDPNTVVGGFHLISYKSDFIGALAKRMHDELNVKKVAPAHCSGHAAFELFKKQYGDSYLFFGLGTTLKL